MTHNTPTDMNESQAVGVITPDPEKLRKAALHLASLRLEVFPCNKNGVYADPKDKKAPVGYLVGNGVNGATTDTEKIAKWWEREPYANIGVKAGKNLLVIDVDCKNGGDGFGDLAEIEGAVGKLPPTPFTTTPSGGRHYFFKPPVLPTGVRIKGRAKIEFNGRTTSIDLRVGNQYVLAPPSVVDDKVYSVEDGYRLGLLEDGSLNVAELPPEWVAVLPKHGERAQPVAGEARAYVPSVANSPERAIEIERCRRYVAKMDASVQGANGSDDCFHAACVIFWDFGLDESEGRPILDEFNARCAPPWSDAELRHKIADALAPSGKTTQRGCKLNDREASYSPSALSNHPSIWQPITLHRRRDCIGDFPTDSLPDWLAKWVVNKANNLQIPAAMLAMLSLGTLSGCLAKRFRVEARHGWQEPVNLYVCPLMPPSNRKSAVLGAAMRPISVLDKKMTEDGIKERDKVLAEHEQIKRDNKAAKRKPKREAAPESTDDLNETMEMLDGAAIPLPPVPPIPQLKCDDTTEEALAVALVGNGNRMISSSAEAVTAFGTILGKYGRGIARSALYLKGHDLNDGHRVDRRNNDPIILDDDFSVTCIYTGQLATMEEESRKNPHLKSSGLFARFLWIVPPSKVGYRKTGSSHLIVDDATDEFYSDRVRKLALAMRREAEPVILKLDFAARERFEEWEAEVEVMLRERGRLGIDNALAEWGGKLAGATLRLAGITHCADRIHDIYDIYAVTTHTPIGYETMQRAIDIADHLIGHAEAFFVGVLEGSGGRSDAHHLANWIVRTKSERFTKSHAHQQCRSRFPKADDIDPAIAELERHHCIRQIPNGVQGGAGRPKSPEFEVNPAMFQTATASEMGIDTTEATPPSDSF